MGLPSPSRKLSKLNPLDPLDMLRSLAGFAPSPLHCLSVPPSYSLLSLSVQEKNAGRV